jgi:hypothetical protein
LDRQADVVAKQLHCEAFMTKPFRVAPHPRLAYVLAAIATALYGVHAASLNDTGQTQCYDGNGATVSCTVAPAADDGRYGRDAAAAAGALTKIGAGVGGFDFSKIANNGSVLPANAALGSGATDWACTRDNVTGLIWEVKTTGPNSLRYSGHSYTWYNTNSAENGGNAGSTGVPNTNVGTCNGTLPSNLCNTQAFVTAVNATALCGYTDWRLPTPPELRSIANYGAGISLDTTYFPNPHRSTSWSASTYVEDPAVVVKPDSDSPLDDVSCVNASCAWVVGSLGDVDGGGAGHAHRKAGDENTRLVRGAPAPSGRACTAGHPSANALESTPSADFTDHGNGTVTHNKTGLMWKQCVEGLSGAACASGAATEKTWSNALAAAESASFAGFTDWRLPNLKELHSIVETCGYKPAINQNMFPAMPAPAYGSVFWSASTDASSPANAWVFVFGNGGGVGTTKASLIFSRLVRGGQAFDAFDSQAPPPTSINAAAITSTRVDVSWGTVSGATGYQIDRLAAGGVFTQIGTSLTNSYSDLTVTNDKAYLYRVRAVHTAATSINSTPDLAATVSFTNDPLTAGTVVQAMHLSQLRTAVNAVRSLAGQPAAVVTDLAAAGTTIKGVHVTELRAALDEARAALSLTTGGYTNSPLAGAVIRAVDFQELRNRVQ